MKESIGSIENSVRAAQRLNLRMALCYSILVLALMLTIAGLGAYLYHNILTHSNREMNRMLSSVLSDSISRVSFAGKYQSRSFIEHLIQSEPRINYIIIADRNLRIMAHSDTELNEKMLDGERQKIFATVIKTEKSFVRQLDQSRYFITEIAVPFRGGFNQEIRGVVFTGITNPEMYQGMRVTLANIIFVVALLAILSLVITYVISNWLANPVKDLALELKGILDYSPMMICVTEKDSNTLHCSESYRKFLQRRNQNFLVPEIEEVNRTWDVVVNQAEIGEGDERENFLTTSFPLNVDRAGRPIQICAIGMDITDQLKTNEALKESEFRYRELFDKSYDSLLILDNGVFVDCNEAAVQMLRCRNKGDIINKSPGDFAPEKQPDGRPSAEQAQELIQNALRYGALRFEFVHRRMNGEDFNAEIILTAIPGETHKILHVAIRDVTARTNAVKALREQEENLRITLNSIGDAVISTDRDSRIVRMNPVAEKLTGWNWHSAVDKPLDEVFRIVDAETGEHLPSPPETVLASGKVVALSNNAVMISRDGTRLHVADSGAPILNEAGEIVGVVLVFRDVTEQRMVEEQLRQSQKMDSIGQLAGGIAHDFNNMLTGIMGAADVLSRKLSGDPKMRQYAEIIVNASHKASSLTRKLLDFSRKGKLVSTSIDVHAIIRDTILLLERSIDRRIEIRQHLSAGQSCVDGDPVQLQNALVNLCINARDAMPQGGTLTISTQNVDMDWDFCHRHGESLAPGKYIKVSVKDTGHGIEPQIMNRIFEPFFTTKEIGEGTGLGLPAAYGAISEHKGLIECNSKPRQGAEFIIYLPVELSAATTAETAAPPDGNGKTILIIDDEEFVRRLAQDILQDLGYKVIVAPDGIVGSSIFAREKDHIDLVIIDMVMPGLSGRETFLKLAELDPGVRVVFSSGFTRDQGMEDLLNKNNVKGFVQKPFRIADLGDAVAAAIRGEDK